MCTDNHANEPQDLRDYQICRCSNFLIDGVNATIRDAIHLPVVEWQGRHLKKKVTSVKHKNVFTSMIYWETLPRSNWTRESVKVLQRTFILGSEHGLPGRRGSPVFNPQSTVSWGNGNWKPWRYTWATEPSCNSLYCHVSTVFIITLPVGVRIIAISVSVCLYLFVCLSFRSHISKTKCP